MKHASDPTDNDKYRMETGHKDLRAAWEDWYKMRYGQACN